MVEPFDAVELDLSEWWAGVAGGPADEDDAEPEWPAPPSSESGGG